MNGVARREGTRREGGREGGRACTYVLVDAFEPLHVLGLAGPVSSGRDTVHAALGGRERGREEGREEREGGREGGARYENIYYCIEHGGADPRSAICPSEI